MSSFLTSILRSACGLVLAAAAALAGAQQITIVSVTANGFGKTEAEAMTSAVINGVAQVNGEAIASSIRVKSTSTSSDAGTNGERTIEKDIARLTQGVSSPGARYPWSPPAEAASRLRYRSASRCSIAQSNSNG